MPDVKEMYDTATKRVEELDDLIDSASDSKGAGQRAVKNRLIADNEGNVKDLVVQISEGFADEDPQVKFGVYFGLLRELKNAFDEAATAYVDTLVETRPEVQKASDAEVAKAQEERGVLAGVIKHLVGILTVTNPELKDELKVPRKRPVGGARGKRAISYYTWTVNGVAFEGGITELAKSIGYTDRPADLRDEMKKADIDLTNPPQVINFTTPSGVVLVGTKDSDAPDFSKAEKPENDEDDDETLDAEDDDAEDFEDAGQSI